MSSRGSHRTQHLICDRNRLMKDEEDPQKSERPPWHTTSLRLRFRPIILRDKDQASAETHGREDSPSITSAQTTRPGVKSSFNNSGPSHQAPPTLPSQVEVSGKPFYQRAPAVLGAGGTRISPLPPLSERSVTPSVGPRSSVSPTKAGLEELEAVWRQSNTPTSVNQDLPRETSAPPPGSHISDVASLYTRLNDTSLSPEKEAGPSRNRSRASSAAQGSLSFGISKKTRESILKANLLPKVDGKLLLAKISDLSAFDVDQYPKEARCEYDLSSEIAMLISVVLSKEVEEFLKPRTTEKHAIEVQKRGYTTMELRHVLAGKPMKGVGSRPGAQKTKIHGIDVPSGDLGVDEEDGHLGQGGQGPSTVLPFVVETRIADEKKVKGRGKEGSQGGANSTSAPGESMAVDDLEKGIDNGAIGFEEEDDPLVTIDDIDMTF